MKLLLASQSASRRAMLTDVSDSGGSGSRCVAHVVSHVVRRQEFFDWKMALRFAGHHGFSLNDDGEPGEISHLQETGLPRATHLSKDRRAYWSARKRT